MQIKPKNIVRVKGTNDVYEVMFVSGTMLLCNAINNRIEEEYLTPLKASEVEVIMEEETEIFNILFKGNVIDE